MPKTPNDYNFIADNPDLKHIEMIGQLLLARGREEHARYGNMPDLIAYSNSRTSEQVTHTITAQSSTFEQLKAELTQSVGGLVLFLAHTEHKIVPYSEAPRQTFTYLARIAKSGSVLKISHGIGKFKVRQVLPEYDSIPLNNYHYGRDHELGYFTGRVEGFIRRAGIDLAKTRNA